jgi:putative transcriptional regulator
LDILERTLRMKISYNNLWKILIDRNMQKKDLIVELGISSTTIAKMGKGEKVSLDVLERICLYFDCNIGDVISFEKENK